MFSSLLLISATIGLVYSQDYHYIPVEYDYGANSRVTANLTFGTGPAHPVKVVMDTGSPNMWVWQPGANISYGSPYLGFTGPCSLIVPTEYDPSTSPTSRISNHTSAYAYGGNGKIVSGTQYANDTITAVGGNGPIPNVQFALENTALIRIPDNGSCLGIEYDKAILGLSPIGNNITTGPSFRQNLFDAGRIASRTMVMWFNKHEGPLGRLTGGTLFGAIDKSKYTGSLVRVPVVTKAYKIGIYVPKPTVTLNGQTFTPSQNTTCLVDSGSHADALPFTSAESSSFFAASGGQLFGSAGYVTWNGSCESIPQALTIGYTFLRDRAGESITIDVPLRNYARGQTVFPDVPNTCVLSLQIGGCVFAAPFSSAALIALDDGDVSVAFAQGGVSEEGSGIDEKGLRIIGIGESYDTDRVIGR